MDAINCMNSRQSIRLFLNKEIPDSIINQILKCAINAPSSIDCQPWHFIIVKDKEKQKRLAKLKSADNQNHILTAPVTIIVCVDTEKSPSRFIEDGVCATQNILLAAHSLGLGSVYVTGCKQSNPKIAKEVREILNIPEGIMPITILPIGYINPIERLDSKSLLPLSNITHKDCW